MYKYSWILIVVSLALASCNSCNKDKKKEIVLKVDEDKTEEIKINLVTKRFDKDLLSIDGSKLETQLPQLKKEYGTFFNVFAERIINIGKVNSSGFNLYLKSFIMDPTITDVQDSINKKFSDTKEFDEAFKEAFKRYNYFYPNKTIPQIVYMLSGFNYAIVTTDSVLGIGLEMFLGKDCKFYQMLSYPQYKINMLCDYYLVADAMKSWIATEFETKLAKEDLLHTIIQEGKILYFIDNVLPESQDSIKISYTAPQMEWATQNEANVWKYLIDKKLLFTTNYKEIVKLTKEAPFSTGLPHESPAMIGNWIGWQIVRSYMKNNPTITLQQLMNETDAQKILNKSKYKPL